MVRVSVFTPLEVRNRPYNSLISIVYLPVLPKPPAPRSVSSRLSVSSHSTRSCAPDHVIRQLIHTITVSYSDPDFHVTEALTATGYSKDHIRRQFHQFTGMTPNEYLTDIRIQYAKRLLRQKNKLRLPVSEIAWMCGFYDAAYFCRLFRKHVGVSPSEYSTSFLH